MAMITIREYGKLHGKTYGDIYSKIRAGVFTSVKRVGERWYIDENEPWKDGRIRSGKYVGLKRNRKPASNKTRKMLPIPPGEKELQGLILITEYCERYGLNCTAVSLRCRKGMLKSAVKIGNRWFIDEFEPYVDKRIKSGKFIKSKEKLQYYKLLKEREKKSDKSIHEK